MDDQPEQPGAPSPPGSATPAALCLAAACLAVLLLPLTVWLAAKRETQPDGYTHLDALITVLPLHGLVFLAAMGAALVFAWRGVRQRTPGSWPLLIACIFVNLLILEAYWLIVTGGF